MMALNFGIITISDRSSKGEREDSSGPTLVEAVTEKEWKVARTTIIPDDFETITNVLSAWADIGDLDIILTTGGTGLGHRDVTPEATKSIIDREVPGMSEAMRAESFKITPFGMISRGVTGVRKQTLIVNLPGSPKAALENFLVILPVVEHASLLVKGDPTAENVHSTDRGD